MLKYKLEKNTSLLCCEVCGTKTAVKKAAAISIKEFHKDGTTKYIIHVQTIL